MADRVKVRVLLVFGEGHDARAELTTPWHDAKDPMPVRAGDIAEQAGLPVNELPGRWFWAEGDEKGLGGFILVDDPRE